MAPAPVGYIALLRQNLPFRRLWYAQVVSQLGDWFDSIALYTLLLALTGSGQAVGALLVAQFLPAALVGPFAGVVIDRLPRKLVMIVSDILRALLVLLLLRVQTIDDIWLIYGVTTLKFALTSFFEPARSAIIPNIASRVELVAANGLSGATWSAMLALGAALGGIVVGTLGVRAAFLLDAATFVLSAFLVWRVPFKEQRSSGRADADAVADPSSGMPTPIRHPTPGDQLLPELSAGLRFVGRRTDLLCYTFSKALWSLSGGVLLLLTLYGREIFPVGRDGATSIGLFYAARGIGAGVGPLLASYLGGGSVRFLQRAIGPAFFLSALGYLWISGSQTLLLALLAVLVAHMGGSVQWVYSTVLLQMAVPDHLRGRVFAIEYAALTLTTALSAYLTGVANDAGWTPRALAVALALMFVLPGLLLTLVLWQQPQRVPPDSA